MLKVDVFLWMKFSLLQCDGDEMIDAINEQNQCERRSAGIKAVYP